MAKKKPDSAKRKPFRKTRIREDLAAQLDELTQRHASDFTEEVKLAVREYLERNGLWPPPKDAAK